ncbi:MAG: PAS domain S-box protein [Pseudomonadota bacterium]
MKDQSKTKQALIQELASLRKRITELEQSESERKQAEKALRESEACLRMIVEASLDAIIAVNTEGQLVLFNGAAQ